MNYVKDEFRYLSVAPRDCQWGLYVTAAGAQLVPANAQFRSKGHSPAHDYLWQQGRKLHEYAIVYVVRGQIEFETKSVSRAIVGTGTAILLFPEIWHRYRPVEKIGCDSFWVTFQGDYADRLCEQGFLSPLEPLLETGMDELVLRPFTRLMDRTRSQPFGFQPLIAADLLAIIAGMIAAVQRRQTSSHIQKVVCQAKAAMEAADELPSIEDLVQASGLGRSRFFEVFKECTGVTPYQYHLQLRMNRARELLRGSGMSVKEVAAVLRFNSVYQFSRIFTKKTGMSPSRYRRLILAGNPL